MGILIPIDNFRQSRPSEFESALTLYCRRFQPKGVCEMGLVEQLAHDSWRLSCIHQVNPEPPDDPPSGATAVLLKAA